MPHATEEFIISNVRWNYVASREIGPNPPRQYRSSVCSATVQCRKCGETWEATEGREPGQFRPTIGFLHLTCPTGDAAGAVPMAVLNEE